MADFSNNDNELLISRAAQDVMTLARNTLIVNLRFLDIAISRLELEPSGEMPQAKVVTLATDGVRIIYEPRHVLRTFRDDHDQSVRDYLHMIMHCLFSHMFVGTLVDRRLWNLACDIAAENAITDLGLRVTSCERETAQRSELERLRSAVGIMTAEKIYKYLRENAPDAGAEAATAGALSDADIRHLSRLFAADDHTLWYKADQAGSKDKDSRKKDGRGDEEDHAGEQSDKNRPDEYEDDFVGKMDHFGDIRDLRTEYERAGDELGSGSDTSLEDDWKKIAEKVREDMETFSRQHGDAAGGMMQNLRAVTREKYDYTDFLRKFAVMGEAMMINDDEFDYIYYTYGLRLYGNLPLVEPLEYKEVRKIRDFVIAIDTSGSTSGELVQRFLQKTYNILKSTESYFSKVNIHIVQCDSKVQEHVRITCQEDFDNYLDEMQILGLGGTNFRPVFDLTDELIARGELTNLRGLIYFTDGFGVFPSRKPDYETAFVFLDNEFGRPEVPPWAIRLVLQDEEI